MGLLTPGLTRLLTAVTRQDADGLAAFKAWRAETPLDDVDAPAFKVMPMLAAAAAHHDVPENDLRRMKGVARYIWVANTLQLRMLFEVIDLLARAGVEVMVIKGAALFAREVSLSTRRMSSDYDILIEPGMRVAACGALEAAGYEPGQGFSWSDLKFGLADRSGAPVRKGAAPGEIDLHWRPLQDIGDPELMERMWNDGERRLFNGKAVRIPALADHLFCTLARPEPWDRQEAFQRLIEAFLILTTWPAEIDWARVGSLARRYGLRLRITRLLAILVRHCGVRLPHAAFDALKGRGAGEALDERLRRREPAARSPIARWYLERRDRRLDRQEYRPEAIALRHAFERQFGLLSESEMRREWRRAAELERHFPASGLRFVQGFSSAEPGGRWTDGTIAVLRVPLARGPSRNLSIPVLPYTGPRKRVTVRVCNGTSVVSQVLEASAGAFPVLQVTAEPVAVLGGDGLLLFDLGFALSPASINASPDIRVLGLFFPASATAAIDALVR